MARRAALAATATIVVAASALAGAPAPASAQTTVVEQGGRFATGSGKSCTIGLNDPARGVSYSAAHCGKRGDLVYFVDENGYRFSTPVGIFEPSSRYDFASASNDWSLIRWYPGVKVQPNRFGGDYYPASKLSPGEQMCFHGYTSHGAGNRASCGRYLGSVGQNVYYEVRSELQAGDSGGPVFVPGKGTVGVVAGNTTVSDGRTSITVGRAAATSDGPLVDAATVNRLVAPLLGQRVKTTVQDPGETDLVKVRELSSNPASVLGPLIAVLAALLPLVGGWMTIR